MTGQLFSHFCMYIAVLHALGTQEDLKGSRVLFRLDNIFEYEMFEEVSDLEL